MPGIHLQIQTVLFNNDKASLERSHQTLVQAVAYGRQKGLIDSAQLLWGDSSAHPLYTQEEIDGLNKGCFDLPLKYTFFDGNLGSAGGQNALAKDSDADFLFIINPDILAAYNIFELLLAPFENSEDKVGITECKQMPVEHPKDYDIKTLETSWATGACTFIKNGIFREVGGYDSRNFFMYCDDVDLSWRVRFAGYKVLLLPNALVFHDKRFGQKGEWLPGEAEVYYSAEAAMMMAYKWSYRDLFKELMQDYERSSEPLHKKAVLKIKKRLREGAMPEPMDPDHNIGGIVERNFGKMRYII